MTTEEIALWLNALIKAEDEAEVKPMVWSYQFPYFSFSEEFEFYVQWYLDICDAIEPMSISSV